MLIEELYKRYQSCSGVSTDTRRIEPNGLFFALKGDSFDGNAFAAAALEKGAAYAVVDDPAVVQDERYLLVEDVLTTLQELARYHRRTFDFPVVGLTGSNGKTTTKELIAAVLSKQYRTYATRGNLNNHIGVPLTLLAIDPNAYDIAVVEMGANHRQEIALLSSIAQPTHGLITNVGKAHLEGFGGMEGVKKGKGELYDYLSKKQGTVFVNAQNETLMEMVSQRRAFAEIVFYRTSTVMEGEPVNPLLVQESPFIVYEGTNGQAVSTHLPGGYNFDNICAALAVGAYFEVPESDAHRAISEYQPDNNRSQVIQKGTNTLYLDAYNANPSSMAAAIENFARLEVPHKMVILGDMLELGPETEAEHRALGELVAQGQFEVVVLAGKLMASALPPLPKAYYFPDKFSLHNWIMDNPRQNTHVLIKGSRGMSLESTVPFF
ncbi:UDP-N-acetylmuramoyl-tripeptide--D-alanyl-D-alanine ligase [Rhabdobacter roseus]|nr:UDP-N-acetylmuramoyl-tripeptide--D-alanyl-D-alanine ligase [Rhabdobacter roseus]